MFNIDFLKINWNSIPYKSNENFFNNLHLNFFHLPRQNISACGKKSSFAVQKKLFFVLFVGHCQQKKAYTNYVVSRKQLHHTTEGASYVWRRRCVVKESFSRMALYAKGKKTHNKARESVRASRFANFKLLSLWCGRRKKSRSNSLNSSKHFYLWRVSWLLRRSCEL